MNSDLDDILAGAERYKGHVIRYTPAYVELDDADYIPVPVMSVEDMLSIEWISRWSKAEDPTLVFQGFGKSTDRFSAWYEQGLSAACLWAVFKRAVSGLDGRLKWINHTLLIAHVSDIELLTSLPWRPEKM